MLKWWRNWLVKNNKKRQAMLFSLAFYGVGMTGFEPATPTSRT